MRELRKRHRVDRHRDAASPALGIHSGVFGGRTIDAAVSRGGPPDSLCPCRGGTPLGSSSRVLGSRDCIAYTLPYSTD